MDKKGGKLHIITTHPDPIDPDAICDRCGRKGTTVRSGRNDIPSATMGRYCRACWPAQHAEHVRQMVEENATHSTVQRHPAPSWDELIALVVAVEQAVPPNAADDHHRQWRRKIALFRVAHEIEMAIATARLEARCRMYCKTSSTGTRRRDSRPRAACLACHRLNCPAKRCGRGVA